MQHRNGGKASKFKRRLKVIALITLSLSSTVVLAGFFYFVPHLNKAEETVKNLSTEIEKVNSNPSVIVSSDGVTLFSIQSQYRRPVTYDKIPETVIHATLAAEDKRFRSHGGIDTWAMMKLMAQTAMHGSVPRGGSTLTMQLAKRIYTSPRQTLDRKLDDMALAIMIERTLTKDQILELYLNQIFYGESAYGIAAAADVYFGKTDLRDLTIAEAALLSRIVRRPSKENPFDDMKTAIKNRDIVLATMREMDWISKDQYQKALKEKPKLAKKKPATVSGQKYAPYYVDAILRQFKQEFPDIDLGMGGYRIEATLNYELQKYAEEEITKTVKSFKKKRVTTGAMLLMDSDGAVLTHVGGGNYKVNEFDVITQGKRQPGSSFKPYVYATALDNHVIAPTDYISNAPYYWNMGNGVMKMVHNSDGVYGGSVPLLFAFKKSLNVVAARLIEKTGPQAVVDKAHESFGFTSDLEAVPSLALGATAVSPVELARAMSVFKTGGDRVSPYFIKRIWYDGEEIKSYGPRIVKDVFTEATAKTMDTFLYEAAHTGTGYPVTREGVVNAHGKTGTTNNYRDAWFCGYTNRFIGVGWVGGEVWGGNSWIYKDMARVFGGTSVGPFWGKIVKKAQAMYGEKLEPYEPYFMSRTEEGTESPGQALIEEIPPSAVVLPDGTEAPVQDPGQNNPPPLEESPPPPTPEDRELEVVYVEICAQSGAKATLYCPETAKKPFLKESAPKTTCPLHKPPN